MSPPFRPSNWQKAYAAVPHRRYNSPRRIYVIFSLAICFILWRLVKSPLPRAAEDEDSTPLSHNSWKVPPEEPRYNDYRGHLRPRHKHPVVTTGFLRTRGDQRQQQQQKADVSRVENFPNIKEQQQVEAPVVQVPPANKKQQVEASVVQVPPANKKQQVEASVVQVPPANEKQQVETPVVQVPSANEKQQVEAPVVQVPPANEKQLRAEPLLHQLKDTTPEEQDDGEELSLKGLAVFPKGKEPPSPEKAVDKILEQILAVETNGKSKNTSKSQHPNKGKDGSKRTTFPVYAEYVAQDERADTLPDIVHMPFEDTTTDVILQGWEDQWFTDAQFDSDRWGNLTEPKIDFIYTWVNGSDKAFIDTIYPYELNSTLNDPEGKWLESHRINRYRDWDELRYSIRTVEKYAHTFRNKIQILVNSVGAEGIASQATPEKPATIDSRQRPSWLNNKKDTRNTIQILSQEDFFDEAEAGCLPSFNSLTIENQIYNTKSAVDRFYAMSDDMLLGKPHAASDLYSPLFGPTMGFKTNAYNTKDPPTDLDARRFGEKPFLIYTSWLLNRRFGERKRKGQVHFGHSLSRSVTREAINSFPRPALQSTCQRFRGETGFQLYSWYAAFHYTIERHREALLWSYIMQRADTNQDGNLGWSERQVVMTDLEQGMANEANSTYRTRMFYQFGQALEAAGLEQPKVNLDILWTSLDGPVTIHDIECYEFNVNECMAPGFSIPSPDEFHTNPVFSTASIFDRVARQHPKCGDCLIKLILNRAEKGLGPLLPHADTQAEARSTVIKALLKYQYTIIEPDALFVMVTDPNQVKNVLLKRLVEGKREVGQLCLNDDVATEEAYVIEDMKKQIGKLLNGLAPTPSEFEIEAEGEGASHEAEATLELVKKRHERKNAQKKM